MVAFGQSQEYISRMYDPSPISDDSLNVLVSMAYFIAEFIPVRTALDRSLSSGKFDMILDNTVSQSIQRLYSLEYSTSNFDVTILKEDHGQMRRLLHKYDTLEFEDAKGTGTFYDRSFKLPLNIPNVRKLLDDHDFMIMNKEYRMLCGILKRQYQTIFNKNGEVQDLIRAYLKRGDDSGL